MKRARHRFHAPTPTMAMDRALAKSEGLAFDRDSVRTFDADGRMRVEVSPISKACVSPYLGSEIPGYVELGLDPDNVYMLLRDPEELAKAADSFNGVQLLMEHDPVSADDPKQMIVVGTTGTDARFESPYLLNSLYVWVKEGIDLITSGKQKELSGAYRYRPDMQPGTFEGTPYDGVMRDISANHVAIVKKGRAGPDVVVGDSQPKGIPMAKKTPAALSRMALLAKGALGAYLQPLLAQDAKIDLTPILVDVTAKNWKDEKPKIVAAVTAAAKGKLAQDADLDDMPAMLDNMDADEPGEGEGDPASDPAPTVEKPDPAAAVVELLSGKVDEATLDQVKNILAGKTGDDAESFLAKIKALCDEAMGGGEKKPAQDEPPKTPGTPEAPTSATPKEKPAMDQAQIDALVDAKVNAAIKTAQTSAVAHINAIAEAKEAVRPLVGEIAVAMDSAAAVYKVALDAAGMKTEGVHESAFPSMVAFLRKQQATALPGALPVMAADSGADDSFATMFPQAGTVRTA